MLCRDLWLTPDDFQDRRCALRCLQRTKTGEPQVKSASSCGVGQESTGEPQTKSASSCGVEEESTGEPQTKNASSCGVEEESVVDAASCRCHLSACASFFCRSFAVVVFVRILVRFLRELCGFAHGLLPCCSGCEGVGCSFGVVLLLGILN